MRPRKRPGVSEYLAVFILAGVAVGGSVLVYSAATRMAGSSRGPGISVLDGTVRAGEYFTTESLTVYNGGTSPVTSFSISTQQVPTGARYCATLLSPGNLSTLSTTCPALAPDPSVVAVSRPLAPGGSVTVELFINGASFTPGTWLSVTVAASSGAEGTEEVEVVPA